MTKLNHVYWTSVVAVCITLAAASNATAAPVYVLSNGNATATFEVGGIGEGDLGQTAWSLDGIEHLAQQWFWYRVGDTGPETMITDANNGLTLVSHSELDLGAGFGHILDLEYHDPQGRFEITMGFTLVGAGNSTTIDEQITIINTSGAPLEFYFFEFLDFDLAGSFTGDVVQFPTNNTVEQADGLFTSSEVVSTSANPPSAYEGGEASAILSKLNDAATDNLSNTPALGAVIAPLDAGVAFQWDWVIPTGGAEQISKLKRIEQVIVPSPSAWAGGLTLLSLGIWLRKRVRS